MSTGFRKIIERIPGTDAVLDVGSWGLDGGNTTDAVVGLFNDITLINIKPQVNACIVADYYTYKFDKKFDLIVLDLNIDHNIPDWEDDFKYTKTLLNPKGKIVCFIMLDGEYGGLESAKRIKKHWKTYWNTDKLTPKIIRKRFPMAEEDSSRPEIYWVLI